MKKNEQQNKSVVERVNEAINNKQYNKIHEIAIDSSLSNNDRIALFNRLSNVPDIFERSAKGNFASQDTIELKKKTEQALLVVLLNIDLTQDIDTTIMNTLLSNNLVLGSKQHDTPPRLAGIVDEFVEKYIEAKNQPLNPAIPQYLSTGDNLKPQQIYYEALITEEKRTPEVIQSLLKDYKKGYALDLIQKTTDPEKQKPLLVAYIRSGTATDISKLQDVLSSSAKLFNAEVLLEASRGITDKDKLAAIDKLYNEKVRENAPTELPQFDKVMHEMSPRQLGELMLSEQKAEKREHIFGSAIEGADLNAFQQAVTSLQKNKQEQAPTITNALNHLSREQMAYVMESVKAYEDFSKKGWLEKAWTKFSEGVQRAFRKGIDDTTLKAGLQELVQKAAPAQKEQLVNQNVGKSSVSRS